VQGADLRPQPPPQVAPVVPQGSIAPPVQLAQVAPPLQQPSPTQGQNVPPKAVVSPFDQAAPHDPNAALQSKRNQLVKDAERERAKGTGWFNRLVNETEADQSNEKYKKMQGEIAEVDQQIQTQNTNQQLAKNFNLFTPMAATADAAAIVEQAKSEWKDKGNIGAYRGLLATGHAQQASIYNAEGFNKLGKDIVSANKAYGYLDSATDEVNYKIQREKAMAEAAKIPNARNLGLTEGSIPKSLEEYRQSRTLVQATKNDAADLVAQFKRQQENRGVPQVISDEKTAGAITGQFQYESGGGVFPNTKAVTLGDMGGQQGAMAQPGSKDLANFGDQNGKPGKYHDMNEDKYKKVTEMFTQPEEKGAINKYKSAQDFYKTVMNDENFQGGPGVAMVYDKLGGVFRNVAEAAQGSGTIGFTKQLELKFGTVDNALNQLYTNASSLKAWLQSDRKGAMPTPEPRLSPQAIKGFRDAAKFELDLTKEQLTRLEGPIGYLGKNGGSLSQIGLDKEAQELLQPLLNEATQQSRLDKDKFPSKIYGTQRVYLPQGTTGEGVIPAGSYEEHINAINKNVIKPETPTVVTPPPTTPPPTTPPPTTPPRVIPGPTGGPAAAAGVPNYLRGNPVASTVYSTASQTAMNLDPDKNPVVGNNVAALVTSSAKNESNFKPHELHDKDQATGRYAGYGLFGHQGDRLSAMQKHGGVPVVGVPGEAISPEAQTTFYTREIMDAAKKDPFIKATLENPNASAEDLTRVQMRMEKPEGYVKGQEEKGKNWAQRLASTQTLLLGQRGRLTSTPQEAEAAYNASQSKMMTAIPRNAPAILGTAANVATTPFGPGVQAGATLLGGVTGGVIKNAVTGTPEQQTWGGYTEAGIKGGGEVAPMMVPGGGYKALAGRALTAGAVAGAEELYDSGGDIPKALTVSGASTLSAAASETFMNALGKGFSGIYKMATNNNQKAMEAAGKILSEQKAKTMLADGSTIENKAFTTAKEWAESKNIDPDHLAHAFEEASRKSPVSQALPARPGAKEQRQAAAELESVQNQIGDKGAALGVTPRSPAAGAPFTPIPGGPVDSILTGPTGKGKIDAKYMPEAAQAEYMLQKPAQSMGHRWENAAQAREDLLKHERTAKIAGDTVREEAMRAIANTVRKQQEAMARSLLPKNEADALISQLQTADKRYRTAVLAGGDDIVRTIAAGGPKGNQAKVAFDSLAAHDQDAKNLVASLVRAENRKTHGGVLSVMLGATGAMHFFVGPVATGAAGVISTVKAGQMIHDYMRQKGAGKPATIKQLVGQSLTKTEDVMRRGGATIGGSVGSNAGQDFVTPP
jgi:hypothetical protein